MDPRARSDDLHDAWPELPWREWQPTIATVHMWTQIVGKIRMALAPPLNHWWHVPLYVSARGLTTSPIPYRRRSFQVDFDFIDHRLLVTDSSGGSLSMALEPKSVGIFYREFMDASAKPWDRGADLVTPSRSRGRHPLRARRAPCARTTPGMRGRCGTVSSRRTGS